MKLKVYTKDGSSFTEQDFANIPEFEGDKGLFALKETIVAYRANARQGNASTLDYGHVSGTCRKPFKQKGGGRSRHGTFKSVIHRGGAVVFGPQPRDWSKKINRKAKALALSRAIFDKCAEDGLCVIEEFAAPEKKTKAVAKVLGTANNNDDKDEGVVTEISVPKAIVGLSGATSFKINPSLSNQDGVGSTNDTLTGVSLFTTNRWPSVVLD